MQQSHKWGDNMGQTIINVQDYKYHCLANINPIEKQGMQQEHVDGIIKLGLSMTSKKEHFGERMSPGVLVTHPAVYLDLMDSVV